MKESIVKRGKNKSVALEIFAISNGKQAKVGARVKRADGAVIHEEAAEYLTTWGDAACRALCAVMNGSSNRHPMSHEESLHAAEMLPDYVRLKFGK